MSSASAAPDGAIAPTLPGAESQARKNEKKSCDMAFPVKGLARPEEVGRRAPFSPSWVATALRIAAHAKVISVPVRVAGRAEGRCRHLGHRAPQHDRHERARSRAPC